MGPVQETIDTLRKAAEKSDGIAVFFSGGKDSLCTLDLCARTFKRVVLVHMYIVPGLRCIEERLQPTLDRYPGIPLIQYPHWVVWQCLQAGVYCDPRHDDLEFSLRDLYNFVVAETGLKLIASGARRSDSGWRRRFLKNTRAWEDIIYPIVGWNLPEVLAYLARQKIQLPEQESSTGSGVDLSRRFLLWCLDHYPDDFARIERVFPYVGALRKWKELYGR